jgi:hypothetical protein
MILRTGFIALLFTFCLSGCTTIKPQVWKAQDVSFTNFEAFEIKSSFNATGKSFDQDYLTFLTAYLKKQFKEQNLELNDTPQTKSGILIVETAILVLETEEHSSASSGLQSSWIGKKGKVLCSLSTRLIEKSTSQVVARISTTKAAGQGIYSRLDIKESVLKESAASIAKEVAKLMKTMEPI